MTIQCIIHFAQAHAEFRLPELSSVGELYAFKFTKPASAHDSEQWDSRRPFWIVELQDEAHAAFIAQRCILVKSIYELYGQGSSYADVHAQTRSRFQLWSRYINDTSFRFVVSGYKHSISQTRQKEIVESFNFMDLQGRIEMNKPGLVLACFEEYVDYENQPGREKHQNCIEIFFGRLISQGTARSLINKFDVKKRAYFGNTSMEAEVSLLMANQTLAAPGKLIYDPFIGTGSMAYTTAHFGAQLFGSDIDGRQMRGKGQSSGILLSASQYNVTSRIIDLCTFDITSNPWRCGELFDAIVTDPPYGVRAGAKRLGRKNTDRRAQNRSPRREAHSRTLESYIPPTKPYELSQLVVDLVLLARYLLKPDGRLVFFLPTVTDEYEEIDIHLLLCDGMTVIANSLQDFGSWGRRLITVKKTTSGLYTSPFADHESSDHVDHVEVQEHHIPAHKDFRDKYFRKFKREGTSND